MNSFLQEADHHDPLTNLPNSYFLFDRLRRALARRVRYPERLFAVLYLDLDHLSVLNDGINRVFGDSVLQEVSRRLQRCIRSVDIVVRLREDEFLILIDDINEPMDAIYIAERVQRELVKPIELLGYEALATACIGIAVGSDNYEKEEDILQDAETAMRRAKRQGAGRCVMFNGALQEQAEQRLRLESDLCGAIKRNELRIHYQPIVSLGTEQIVGVEALVRWQSPNNGLLFPKDFLRIAESSDLMIPISKWILQNSCKQLACWQAELPVSQELYVSVNIPNQYLEQATLLEEIDSVIVENRLKPFNLTVEITENQFMEHPESVADILKSLRRMGVNIALDDFGKGYSSLNYLANLPAQILKIDQSFIAEMCGCHRNEEVVRIICSLGDCLGLKVIAEGVETAEQLVRLQEMGCSYFQGFFFAHPLEAKLLEPLLIIPNKQPKLIQM